MTELLFIVCLFVVEKLNGFKAGHHRKAGSYHLKPKSLPLTKIEVYVDTLCLLVQPKEGQQI